MMGTVHTPAWTPAQKVMGATVAMFVVIVAGVLAFTGVGSAGRPGAAGMPTPSASAGADKPPSPGPLPGALPTTGSEVPPPPDDPPTTTPGGRLPPRTPDVPLLNAPLPATGSQTGALVDGYPADVAGPLPESDVLSSSISTEGSAMQLSLVATSSATPDALRAHYRALWTALGLSERAADQGTLAFSGAYESLSLNITSSGTGNRYTVFGVMRTE